MSFLGVVKTEENEQFAFYKFWIERSILHLTQTRAIMFSPLDTLIFLQILNSAVKDTPLAINHQALVPYNQMHDLFSITALRLATHQPLPTAI